MLSSPLAARLQLMNVAGLNLLSRLERITPTQNGDQLLTLIACLASFTDQREPWSSTAASEQAKLILGHILEIEGHNGQQRLRAVLTDLLQLHVKPVFAKFKNAAITRQGRKAVDPPPSRMVHHEPEEEMKAWEFSKAHTISVYGWVLSQLDVKPPRGMSLSGLYADDL